MECHGHSCEVLSLLRGGGPRPLPHPPEPSTPRYVQARQQPWSVGGCSAGLVSPSQPLLSRPQETVHRAPPVALEVQPFHSLTW